MQVHQEKRRAKFRVSFIFLFIIASFAVCFTLYMRGDFDASEAIAASNNGDVSTLSVADINSVSSIVNPVRESERAEDIYLENISFISGTQMRGLTDYRIISNDGAFFSDDLSVKDIDTATLSKYTEGKQGIYVMVGINDLDSVGDENLFDALGKFAEDNQSVQVYLVSLIPVTDKYESDSISNAKINAYNSAMLKYANENQINYLDLNTMFVGNDGKLPDSKTEVDGVRLKKDAYIEIGEYILTHISDN